jgi:hypothetical protein
MTKELVLLMTKCLLLRPVLILDRDMARVNLNVHRDSF